MSDLNNAMIIGRLGRDVEVKYLPSGVAVASFSLATTDKWKDKNTGEMREKTEWHRIVAFGRLGEICGQYLSKGKQVFIEGRLRTRSWEKDGVTRYTTEIEASNIQLLGGGQQGEQRSNQQQQGGWPQPDHDQQRQQQPRQGQQQNGGYQQTQQPNGYGEPQPPAYFDDDIPF